MKYDHINKVNLMRVYTEMDYKDTDHCDPCDPCDPCCMYLLSSEKRCMSVYAIILIVVIVIMCILI